MISLPRDILLADIVIHEFYYFSDLLSFNTSIYPAVIIPAGSATTAIPNIDEIIVTIRPVVVTG